MTQTDTTLSDRQTDTVRQTDRQTDTLRQTDTQTDRYCQTDWHTLSDRHFQTDRQTDTVTQKNRHDTVSQTLSDRHCQTDRQTWHGQTDRQTETAEQRVTCIVSTDNSRNEGKVVATCCITTTQFLIRTLPMLLLLSHMWHQLMALQH